jgi:GNAT superfamily N-acetyltransferase
VSACIARQAFDSEMFGVPFYRVLRLDAQAIRRELAALSDTVPRIIDAKLPADDLVHAQLLLENGFRKTCMQFELVHDLSEPPPAPAKGEIADRLELPEEVRWEHARNFLYDRFSLDPLLPDEAVNRLYRNWITNSLSGRKRVVHDGSDFCSFSEKDDEISIDLLSVLCAGRGIGSGLLARLIEYGRDSRLGLVRVVTECENRPAWRLYLKSRFRVGDFRTVFHLVVR